MPIITWGGLDSSLSLAFTVGSESDEELLLEDLLSDESDFSEPDF
jgi:hypothetical protein